MTDYLQDTDADDGEQITNRELADDTDASLAELIELVDFDQENSMSTPFGPMTEAELIELIRPMLHDWVRTNPDQARQFLAVLHLAAGDLLSKHGDADPEEIVERLGD